MDSSGEIVDFNDEMFMKQNSEDFGSIIASEFETFNSRKLFDRVKSIDTNPNPISSDQNKSRNDGFIDNT